MSERDKDQNSVASWVFIAVACFGIMGAMIWIVGSHLIVYHTAPVLRALGSVWRLMPDFVAGTAANDIQAQYWMARRYAATTGFQDWLHFANLCLKPYSYLFVLLVVGLFYRQTKVVKSRRVNARLGPKELAWQMSSVFSETAPVVGIQESLVANKLPAWRRQLFPEELIKKLRYQGKKVLVPDPSTPSATGDRGLMLDEARLIGALRAVDTYVVDSKRLLYSPYLGRQIVDLINDSKENRPGAFADRMSDVGKAIFAILAPYAFGGQNGRKESRAVIDALNYSAMGTKDGQANLSQKVVEDSFNKWRANAKATRLSRVHLWEYTYLYALLAQAQRRGKIGTWSFIWLKPMNRALFYALNTVGRNTPHAESGLVFSQVQYEEMTVRSGRLPLTPNGSPQIFTPALVSALTEEWKDWREGDDTDEDWWLDWLESALSNSAVFSPEESSALSALSSVPPLPPSGPDN